MSLWEEIEQMFKQSSNEISLKNSIDGNKHAVEQLKISEESVLANMLIHTSGVIINGYLRVLGKEGALDILLFRNKKIPRSKIL